MSESKMFEIFKKFLKYSKLFEITYENKFDMYYAFEKFLENYQTMESV